MTGESRLQRVAPEELPELLARLNDGQVTELALIGPSARIFPVLNNWPRRPQRLVAYQLSGVLSRLPKELFRLHRLQALTLWSLGLRNSDVAEIIQHFGQLTSLNLSDNNIGDVGVQAITPYLGQLTSLDLRYNNVSEVGAQAIAQRLRQLTVLNLSDNLVGNAGAQAIAQNLGQLTSLDLCGNLVTETGAQAIALHLGQLTSLDLSFNNVGEVGIQAIAQHLGQLTSLDLSDDLVGDAGAQAIAQNLGQLTSLSLSRDQISEIGIQAIAQHLGQLTSLSLSDNLVGDAGAKAIARHLRQLTSLKLISSKIGDAGAKAIAQNLGQLTSLDLASNYIGDTGAKAIAQHLGQLTSLNICDNLIGDEAVTAIGKCLNILETLDLDSNGRVTMVAPLMHPPLSTLSIAKTGVTDLSPLKSLVLAGLPVKWSDRRWEGAGIYVEDCLLTHPSPEIVQQGPEAVRNYFREIEAQGTDRLFEAKLLIVGEGGAGKTSLLRRLFQPKKNLPTEDETTRGIDIHRHEFPIANDRTFRLNTWDFGGQQIYHATHQFFLTKRSLYVLVDDTRTDDRSIHDDSFKFWLEVVETLSEASPLLIFQNEKGGRSKQIDEPGIKGRFPNVQQICAGNLEDPNSADGLRQAVEYFVQQLPHIGEDVPAKWVTIRNDIKKLAQSEPYISFKKYLEVYNHHLEANRDKALKLSQYLHDLGVFLHFQHPRELRQTVFLQNQWVTDAVFRILDDEQIKAKLGRFTLTDCDRLWADGYTDKEVELRALMVRFELCYRLPDVDEETWLVPQHLSPSKPQALNDWANASDLMLTYRYEFLPRGLVSRLIVRMHRFVTQPDLCWSRGALFEHGKTQVLVETAVRGNEIVLRSRGPEKKALLSVIASDLDALNDSFPGLDAKVSKWVPCLCATCASLKEPALFGQKELLERKQRGKRTIECPKPPDYNDVEVLALLDGMNLEQWLQQEGKQLADEGSETPAPEDGDPAEPESAAGDKTIRIFLASSKELIEDRNAFDLYFRQQNDRLRKEGLYLEIVRWENGLDAMSATRSQDEYNERVRNCDIFVSLFNTKTGKYTEEEFDVAHQTFQQTGRPIIYTYFKKATVSTSDFNLDDLISLRDFQNRLSKLGHFWTEYDSFDGLQKHFRDQLDQLGTKADCEHNL